jgi:integrase
MSAIYADPKAGTYRILFRFGGKQYHKSLLTDDLTKAESLQATIAETLHDLTRGRLTLPADADFWTFVFSGGKLAQAAAAPDLLTLEGLFARYEELLPPGALEANTRATYELHKKHLLRVLGGKSAAQLLTLTDLQDYANRRAKEAYRGKGISPVTIKKEVATLRAVWNEGVRHQLVTGAAPVKGLRYDKAEEALQFMTWREIEDRIADRRLTPEQAGELWDCLFLDTQQVGEVLDFVKANATCPFVYPMFVFVAHTGARRSEMIRCQVEDLDFRAEEVVIREKKRDRSVKLTFRRVHMSPLLREVMRGWLKSGHPGGPHTFCQGDVVHRSKKRSRTTGHQNPKDRATSLKGRMATVRERTERPGHEPLTRKEATYHLRKTLAGSRWEVLRGFHVFRHSFASNLAREGVDQREIDGLMGHTTEAMRRRYRHLFPEQRENAIRKLFG